MPQKALELPGGVPVGLTVYTPINGNLKVTGRYTQGYSCGAFRTILRLDHLPPADPNGSLYDSYEYVRVGTVTLRLPRWSLEVGTLPVCSRCSNQLACIAGEDISLHQDNLRLYEEIPHGR